jgi:RNA polymerase sigma-70 factor (ECF subfamily)
MILLFLPQGSALKDPKNHNNPFSGTFCELISSSCMKTGGRVSTRQIAKANMGTESHGDFEIDLIAKCQEGDRQAFNRLVMHYQNLVYSFLYRLAPNWNDTDDLAQEVFVKVFHSIKKLRDRTQFKGWLYRIAMRVYIDEKRRWKKRKERFVSDEQLLETRTDPNETPAHLLEQEQLQRRLREALDRLPEEFKLAIVLREMQGLSYQEIANALKCSINTVRSRIFRGRQQLQRMLSDQLGV